jgi:hypothetical protein
VEAGVVADLGPPDHRAVEQAARGHRILHDHVVGLAERGSQHGVHLLVGLDEPHQLLRGIAHLLGRGAEMQQASQSRRVDRFGRGPQHPELELLAHLVEPVFELAHLRRETGVAQQ